MENIPQQQSPKTLSGDLRKMESHLQIPVSYVLPVGQQKLPLNEWLGSNLSIAFSGKIHCMFCGNQTKKSFNQGYCYRCMIKLARCDSCMVRPELCHFHKGTCREEDWGKANCFQDHFVYLSHTSDVKVGITRGSQVPTRWIDQGAVSALPIIRVRNRLQSGKVEVALKDFLKDRTNWRAMLKDVSADVDLEQRRQELSPQIEQVLADLRPQFDDETLHYLAQEKQRHITYPVLQYPSKVIALNLDKTPHIEDTLLGIKGQYLILDSGVLNVRKFAGYHVRVSVH